MNRRASVMNPTMPYRAIGVLIGLVIALGLVPGAAWAASIREYVTPTHGTKTKRDRDVEKAPSAPYGITAGPDRAMWFVENGANKIGRVTTDGQFEEFEIPPPIRGLTHITTGPDGALWFTQYAANKIGRITTAGIVSEYELPNDDSMPAHIVAGPDGALWFTEAYANKIGRITTDGNISEFTIPTQDSTPVAITVGPDGALWFTEYGANKIGRVTTDGSFSEYEIPTRSSLPSGIAAGSDGALWFTENSGGGEDLITPPGKIGRLALDGTFNEFDIPISASNKMGIAAPTAITAGPDGALWFAAPGANEIVRMTTDGRFTNYKIPTSSSGPQGVAFGPDEKLWFTELNDSKVGKVTAQLVLKKKKRSVARYLSKPYLFQVWY